MYDSYKINIGVKNCTIFKIVSFVGFFFSEKHFSFLFALGCFDSLSDDIDMYQLAIANLFCEGVLLEKYHQGSQAFFAAVNMKGLTYSCLKLLKLTGYFVDISHTKSIFTRYIKEEC